MHYVYILKSLSKKGKLYVGVTNDIERRLDEHNEGLLKYTSGFRPWELETYVAFSKRSKAEEFEKYLKHGSGFSFMKKHLV